MADSPNHVTVAGAEDFQLIHINKSEADLVLELQENQSGIADDTKRLIFRSGYISRLISEDRSRNVRIGDITADEKLHVDGNIKGNGSIILSKTITDAADANRVRVSNRTAYAGSNPTGLLAPVEITDNVLVPTGSKIKIIPPYEGMAGCGWAGKLHINGNIDYGDGNHYPTFRGDFDIIWVKQVGTEIQQTVDEIHNDNTEIGLSESSKNLNVFGSNVGSGTDSCWVGLQNSSGYDIRVYYYFYGSLQSPV